MDTDWVVEWARDQVTKVDSRTMLRIPIANFHRLMPVSVKRACRLTLFESMVPPLVWKLMDVCPDPLDPLTAT